MNECSIYGSMLSGVRASVGDVTVTHTVKNCVFFLTGPSPDGDESAQLLYTYI